MYVEYLRLYFVLMKVSAWMMEALENVSKGIYMQGIEVCLKSPLGVTAKTSLLHEASILSKLCHQTVGFLHGVQCEKSHIT